MRHLVPVLAPALVLVLTVAPRGAEAARFWTDFEAGAAFNTSNDVRIPGDTGTEISLTDDLEADPAFAWRVRAGVVFNDRHQLFALVAPLRIDASGSVDQEVSFDGAVFPAGVPLDARYRFDSYRLTYRYDFVRSPKWRVGAGFTAKLRDAAIRLQSGSQVQEKTNTGFVPLLAFHVEGWFSPRLGMLLDGDALAAPQGRAEDVLLAIAYRPRERFTLRAGYRLLEGGADNDEVYNFALVQSAVAGIAVGF